VERQRGSLPSSAGLDLAVKSHGVEIERALSLRSQSQPSPLMNRSKIGITRTPKRESPSLPVPLRNVPVLTYPRTPSSRIGIPRRLPQSVHVIVLPIEVEIMRQRHLISPQASRIGTGTKIAGDRGMLMSIQHGQTISGRSLLVRVRVMLCLARAPPAVFLRRESISWVIPCECLLL